MSLVSSPFFLSQGVTAAEGQSLRFEDGDVAYLSKTFASAGDRTKYTISLWTKLGNRGVWKYLFAGGTSSNGGQRGYLNIDGSDQLYFQIGDSSANTSRYYITDAVYRDPSAWYHIVLAVDTTRANSYNNTAGTNRVELYVNGDFVSFGSATNPVGLNYANSVINNNTTHYIGADEFGKLSSTNVWDGYMANFCFIDGTALDPTSFGEYQDTLWKPKSDTAIQSLTFGTNGFYLPFKQTTEAEGFSTVTYTGNGGTQSIEGVGFEPDLVWTKSRTSAYNHALYDSVRGATKWLGSNVTNAEVTDSTFLSSFDSNGFSIGGGSAVSNASSNNYVAWCWDAGSGSAVSNTDGSITSSVKANTAKGFSIVSYTGTGANATVGHGLSSAPDMIIVKNRDLVDSWLVKHSSLSDDNKALFLNETSATGSSSTYWNNTAPTSSVFSVGTDGKANGSSQDLIAYCFHSVSGYSSIGSYTGTGASGKKITTGFKPAFVMVKSYDQTRNWIIWDNTRTPTNPADGHLHPNGSVAEQTGSDEIQFDSDGFTFLSGDADSNTSGYNYIYMAFADTRDATFFGDTSGNQNNWTPNALNNTDVVPDSPVTGGNFTTLNPPTLSQGTLYEGNLRISSTAANRGFAVGTQKLHGKVYFEVRHNGGQGGFVGIGDTSNSNHQSIDFYDGTPRIDGSAGTALGAFSTGDICGVAVDIDTKDIEFFKNGSSILSTTYTTDVEYFPYIYDSSGGRTMDMIANFGQDSSFAGNETPQGNTDDNGVGDFYYAPPSGYLALTTGNLPTPTITAPDEYFNTVLYTGTGTTDNAVTGVGFQPEFTWIKSRSNTYAHWLNDVVRGAGKGLRTDATDVENTSLPIFLSFDSDGFTVDVDSGTANNTTNGSGSTFVAWNWLAGGTAVSNTDGSITSQVSANTDAGFSIVTYTGTGANATVGHGLASAPEMVIVKNRDSAENWQVYTDTTGSGNTLNLNNTNASAASTHWNSTAPTSSVFSIGSTTPVNGSSDNLIAYCFAEVEGYSKIGSYTGNGSTDGTFVHCGFRPAWVMVKRTDSTSNWLILDNKREGYNPDQDGLDANGSGAEGTAEQSDFLSNGFKVRTNSSGSNASGGTYIFIAFAEAPFKSANAR